MQENVVEIVNWLMVNDVRSMRIRCRCLSLRRTCVSQGATYTAIVGAWASVGEPAQAKADREGKASKAGDRWP